MEISSVVFVFEVAKFMKNHEIGKIAVQPHKMNVKIYIVLPGTASPVATVVFEKDSAETETVLCCKIFRSLRKIVFRLFPKQSYDCINYGLRRGIRGVGNNLSRRSPFYCYFLIAGRS